MHASTRFPRLTVALSAVFALCTLSALSGCTGEAPEQPPPAHDVLAGHTAEFERRVYQVTDGVHVAVGFGLANSILLEGDDGVVIVDTMESLEAAREVREAFSAITTKPVAAIIYTHNHADHIFGARAFADKNEVPVYAHDTTNEHIDRIVNIIRPVIYRRSMAMFGNFLTAAELVNDGIGPRLRSGYGGGTPGLLRPTRTFSDERTVEVAGLRLELVHAPGETDDQIFVWIPEKKTLLSGDNFYRAFPNLYTIRGTRYRDVLSWVRSLDRMRALRPEHLVPSHTRPLSGAEKIQRVLTDYRDAIQFVHDQTVRGMNRGLEPDELVDFVELPPHLAKSPYLQELYGGVEWSVRSVFDGYLGWFDGNPTQLSPLTPVERARRLADLAERDTSLLEAARAALEAGDPQWAAELTDTLLRIDPESGEARAVRARAFRALGGQTVNPNARHFYLTYARVLEDDLEMVSQDLSSLPADFIQNLPITGIVQAMPVNLKAEECLETNQVVGMRFPDVDRAFTIEVRRGIAEVRAEFPRHPDVSITVDSNVWKDIVIGRRNPLLAFAAGDVKIDGSKMDLIRFLGLFERPMDQG